jgi:hypothetical protein
VSIAPLVPARVPVISPRAKARIAGALYLICIACGFFAEMVVRSKLIIYSDPSATARNILESPALYRLGFFADVTAMILGVLTSVIFYLLFKVVSRGLALTVLVLDVISNTVSICGAVLLYAPLIILPGGGAVTALSPAEQQGLALLSIKLYESAYSMNLAVFSGSCLLTGYLIFRSTFLPRTLGVLLAIAGACYLINSFVNFMPPGFGDFLFPWILLPVILGEGLLALWLLIAGIDSSQWSRVAARPRS